MTATCCATHNELRLHRMDHDHNDLKFQKSCDEDSVQEHDDRARNLNLHNEPPSHMCSSAEDTDLSASSAMIMRNAIAIAISIIIMNLLVKCVMMETLFSCFRERDIY